MIRSARLMTAVLCALAALGGTAAAQDPAVRDAPAQMPAAPAALSAEAAQQLAASIMPNSTLDRYRQQIQALFRRADANGDGVLSEADAALHRAVMAARLATSAAMQIMAADLDGDGFVTEAELRQKLTYDQQMSAAMQSQFPQSHAPAVDHDQHVRQEVARMMAADTDRDGRISWIEAMAFTRKQIDQTRAVMTGYEGPIKQLLALAPPGKDQVALADIEPVAEALFHEIDADHNGTVTSEELNAWRTRRSAALMAERREKQRQEAEKERVRREAEAHAGCEMPKASDAAKVILLSAYESDAVSATTIGSQDAETRTGTIAVEPGDEPLYVVAVSFRPIIWRFSGAVARVERVVLTSAITAANPGADKDAANNPQPLAGASGVAADRVTFLAKAGCLRYFTETPSSAAAIAVGTVRRDAGRDVAVVAARYQVSGFAIPSGEIRTSGRADRPMLVIRKQAGTLVVQGGANVVVEAGQSDLAGEVARFYPGGVVEVDPAAVVASRPAARYEVLPNQPGLLQLVQSGALARNRSGEFLIKQKIRFPAELNGAHSVKFLLLRGVPDPDGDPGHSCVIDEASGAPWKKGGGC